VDGSAPTWKSDVLDTAFRSEGVAVADVDRDGRLDVLAGEFWYRAPSWERRELAPPGNYDPAGLERLLRGRRRRRRPRRLGRFPVGRDPRR
jgi:hypothetical protein